jgi:hypothetical protein
MPTLRPFRDYDEKDVINLYAYSGSIPVNKGTLVKIAGDGFRNDVEQTEMLGNMGDFSVNNWVGQRYGALPKIVVAQPTDAPLGMLLFDVKELDENGLPLKYNPRKAAEMEVAISGQAVPIVTRGVFLYSGVVVSGGVAVQAGKPCYVGWNGVIATSGTPATSGGVANLLTVPGSTPIGKFLGATGAPAASGNAYGDNSAVALIWLNLQNN